jgi:hypothetical protein
MKCLIFIGAVLLSIGIVAQEPVRKGNFYGLWGYNRSVYAPSDIHFKGDDYNFIVYDAKAVDFPSEFNPGVYFGLFSFTIPQYNYRIGYFVSNHLSVSIGLDHMKYVLVQGQNVLIDGSIGSAHQTHAGTYNDVEVPLDNTLLSLEHTDGFNYASIELDKHWLVWEHSNKKHLVDWFCGFGLGLMIPRSDVTVLGEAAANEFHIAGEALAVQTGFKATVFKHIFISGTGKAGISRLHDILTTQSRAKAQQNIGWLQGFWQVGFVGKIRKNHKAEQ